MSNPVSSAIADDHTALADGVASAASDDSTGALLNSFLAIAIAHGAILPGPELDDAESDLEQVVADRRPVVCVICGGICTRAIPTGRGMESYMWMSPSLVQALPLYLELQKQQLSTRVRRRKDAGSIRMMLRREPPRTDTRDLLMSIPIHQTCFEICERFCDYRIRFDFDFRIDGGGSPSTISHFYEIWCKRAIATCPNGFISGPILEPNKDLRAPYFPSGYNYFVEMRGEISRQRFLACPLDIPEITNIVINRNLRFRDKKREAPTSDDLVELQYRIEQLPPELADNILAALEPFGGNESLRLEPTRMLPPSWWKSRLLHGNLIPWLWDLDERVVGYYRQKLICHRSLNKKGRGDRYAGLDVFDEDIWDWELLCRQLAQPNLLEKPGFLDDSSQLWNRRRIWMLLDKARLGHVVFS